MKILFQSRKTLFSASGGDTVQLLKTKEYLENLGIQVDISIELRPDVSKYDIVHVFNLMRGQETLVQVLNAKRYNKPVVLSTIYGLYTEYDRRARGGMMSRLFKVLNPYQIEYVKVAGRALVGGELHLGSLQVLIGGYYRTLKNIVKNTDCFLPNSESEMQRVIRDFDLKDPFYRAVPNAVDTKVFNPDTTVVDESMMIYKDCVLSVARIEGRKCQLELVRALKDSPYKLVLVGKAGKHNEHYYNQIKQEAGDNVFFLNQIDHEKLPQLYKIAKVHALVSWMETPGLSTLEAGVMGTNIVATKYGDTYDYFKDYAYYCDPDDIGSIRKAVDAAYNAPFDPGLQQMIRNDYNWHRTAEVTLEAYNKIVSR
jgi:glycosyltransferase involved in cell wall biosynthesis